MIQKVIGLALLCCLTGCIYLKQPEKKLRTLYLAKKTESDTLVVLLPGITDNLQHFQKNGVIDAMQACNPAANILYTEAHFGFYREKRIIKRLHQDIVLPAQKEGIKHIWLFGISLGGLGSLSYWNAYPNNINGVITIGPFLGLPRDFHYFKKGRLKDVYLKDFIPFWESLLKRTTQSPPIYLAYTTKDTYVKQQRWLATLLPAEQVLLGKGQHDWPSWKKLFPTILDKTTLCNRSNFPTTS